MDSAVWAFLESKERQGREERTIYNLKNRLFHFAELTGAKTLTDLTPENCEHFIYRGNSGTGKVLKSEADIRKYVRSCCSKSK